MEISSSCRCCLMRPPVKKLKQPYTRLGKTEIYSNMLKECFEIHLTFLPSDDDCGICKECVGRLRDASDFKLQVLRSQEELQTWLKEACHVKEEEDSLKAEKSEGDNVNREDLMQVSVEVKTEPMVDPLPTDEDEDFKVFMAESHVHKQGPLFEVPVHDQLPCPYHISPKSFISEMFDHDTKNDVKPKKERKFVTPAKNKNASHTCDTCGRQFKRQVGLNIHKQTHKKSDFICEICYKQFKWESRLERHRQIHTGDKPFCSEKCNKGFLSKKNLIKHKCNHTDEKPYACELCNANSKKERLVSHMGEHTGLKHFKCKLCPFKFTDLKSLRTHVRKNHISGKHCICDVCKRTFCNKAELVKHMNIHFKWKIYTCDICGSNLSTNNSLRRHKMVHTGEKAYSCELCNKQFRHKHGLADHKRTHTGEKPHCCEICGKQFAQITNLKTHLAIHVEGQIYACELCTKSYSTSEGLRQHRRTHVKNKYSNNSVVEKQKDISMF